MSKSNQFECVGTLILPSSDLQELSDVGRNRNKADECVGSLLVHQSDLQELSNSPKFSEGINLTKRVSAGTLLVTSNDLRSEPNSHLELPPGSLRRRISDKMTGPAPKDEETENWAD